MRALRWITAAAVVGAVLAIPKGAAANGGAYIDLNRTHYLPGERAIGIAYVSVPARRQGLLDRGPFYAYVVPREASLREGRPIPEDVVRVGTFAIEPERGPTFELRVSFTVPDLPGEFYSIALCNDPCTISGFREPLSGVISVVETPREGRLLTVQSRLRARISELRGDVRKAEHADEQLRARLKATVAQRSNLATEVSGLESELADATSAAGGGPTATRPLIGVWGAMTIAVALLLAAAGVLRRRRSRPLVAAGTTEGLRAGGVHGARR